MKWAKLRVEGVFLFRVESGDLEDDGISLTKAGHERIVYRFIAENPALNREDLDVVDVRLVDEDDGDV